MKPTSVWKNRLCCDGINTIFLHFNLSFLRLLKGLTTQQLLYQKFEDYFYDAKHQYCNWTKAVIPSNESKKACCRFEGHVEPTALESMGDIDRVLSWSSQATISTSIYRLFEFKVQLETTATSCLPGMLPTFSVIVPTWKTQLPFWVVGQLNHQKWEILPLMVMVESAANTRSNKSSCWPKCFQTFCW